MNDAIAYYANSLAVRAYDLLNDGGALVGDIDFYVAAAQRFGTSILELGVGTGRIAVPLAKAGCSVTGLDASRRMLDVAAAKRAELPSAIADRIRLIVGDMREFDLGAQFQLVLIPARAFQHVLEPAMQRSTLLAIRRHLAHGGHLIVDLFDPRLDYCLPEAVLAEPHSGILDPGSGQVIRCTTVARVNDPLRQVLSERLLFEVIDRFGEIVTKEETSWSLRWTYRQEMEYLFELCGFEIVEQFSDFRGAPPAYGREQLWIVRGP